MMPAVIFQKLAGPSRQMVLCKKRNDAQGFWLELIVFSLKPV